MLARIPRSMILYLAWPQIADHDPVSSEAPGALLRATIKSDGQVARRRSNKTMKPEVSSTTVRGSETRALISETLLIDRITAEIEMPSAGKTLPIWWLLFAGSSRESVNNEPSFNNHFSWA